MVVRSEAQAVGNSDQGSGQPSVVRVAVAHSVAKAAGSSEQGVEESSAAGVVAAACFAAEARA